MLSTVLITLALVFYSIGIRPKELCDCSNPGGIVFDFSGTPAMHKMAEGP
jgi:hypothetical protein